MPRRLSSLLAASTLAALVLGGIACQGASTEATTPTTITVVDYNILHGLYDEDPNAPDFDRFEDRLNLLAQELAKIKPDVVVLQETVLSGPKGYPDVKATLLAALGGEYTAVFAESGSERLNEGTFGRMTLTRLPVVSAANRPIFQGRSAHRVTVRTKGGVIDIYNVHMEGPELVGQQELEVSRLLNFIDASRRNYNPVILTGDFNSRPGDAAIVNVKAAGFWDALAARRDVTCDKAGDPGCSRATTPSLANPVKLADIRIDYMFARAGSDLDLRLVDAMPFMDQPLRDENGRQLWVSDHIGIQATYEVSKKN